MNVLGVSERAIAAPINNLTAPLLPRCGFLGAAAFVFRRPMQKAQSAEHDTAETRHAIIRLASGMIVGGVIGLFVPPKRATLAPGMHPVKALGLSAPAPLDGSSVERVFAFFDFVIRAPFAPLKAQVAREK